MSVNSGGGSMRRVGGKPKVPTVMHLIDMPGPGGAETIMLELASRLDKTGWNSLVVVPEPGWLSEEAYSRGLRVFTAAVRNVPLDGRYVVRLMSLMREHDVDLLHAHLLTPAVYGGLAALLRRVPMVCTFHGAADISSSRFLGLKGRIINRAASSVVFVSAALRDVFVARTSIDEGITTVVHNGIDGSTFTPRRNDWLRHELGVAPGQVLVGAVGNVRRAKAYEVLLQAAARLRKVSSRFRFVIVGATNDPIHAELLELHRDLRLGDAVVFAGFRPDVAGVLNGLDLLVSTSSSEGFSLTVVQALACGVPVIATRSGGPEEIVTHGVSGLLVEAGASEQVAAAITRLADDPMTRERLVREGFVAAARFSVEAMVDRYEALYERALGI